MLQNCNLYQKITYNVETSDNLLVPEETLVLSLFPSGLLRSPLLYPANKKETTSILLIHIITDEFFLTCQRNQNQSIRQDK